MERVLIVIPVRYNSTRFLGKPLELINGKPMIWWTYQQGLKVRNADDIVVATDSESVYNECLKYGMKVQMTSEKHLTGTDRLTEVAEKVIADIYVNVQGDEPLIEPEVVEQLIDFMKNHDKYICATVRSKINNPVDVVNTTVSKVVVDVYDHIMYISKNPIPYPKADLNYSYYKALGIYAFRGEALKVYETEEKGMCESAEDIELLRLVERGIKVKDIEVESDSFSVDTPKDLKRIEKLIIERGLD